MHKNKSKCSTKNGENRNTFSIYKKKQSISTKKIQLCQKNQYQINARSWFSHSTSKIF